MLSEVDPDMSIKGAFFLEKNQISKQLILRKIKSYLRRYLKVKLHGKKKNDKDEIGNILLKHVFTSL
jgi:hypothetical protein